jgi:beta-glucosidase-like glycosyl hydrolase
LFFLQQVTAMAATGNMSLIFEMGAVMGRELRAVNNIVKAKGLIFDKGGYLSIYGPTMNIIRDPRW